MELKGTITVDASPRLLDILERFASSLFGRKEAQVIEAVRPEPYVVTTDNAVTESAPEGKEEPAAQPKWTLENIRAAASAKKEKRAEIKAILDGMGVANVKLVPPEKFDEFMTKLSAL